MLEHDGSSHFVMHNWLGIEVEEGIGAETHDGTLARFYTVQGEREGHSGMYGMWY